MKKELKDIIEVLSESDDFVTTSFISVVLGRNYFKIKEQMMELRRQGHVKSKKKGKSILYWKNTTKKR